MKYGERGEGEFINRVLMLIKSMLMLAYSTFKPTGNSGCEKSYVLVSDVCVVLANLYLSITSLVRPSHIISPHYKCRGTFLRSDTFNFDPLLFNNSDVKEIRQMRAKCEISNFCALWVVIYVFDLAVFNYEVYFKIGERMSELKS